eukprot:gene5777-8839_t
MGGQLRAMAVLEDSKERLEDEIEALRDAEAARRLEEEEARAEAGRRLRRAEDRARELETRVACAVPVIEVTKPDDTAVELGQARRTIGDLELRLSEAEARGEELAAEAASYLAELDVFVPRPEQSAADRPPTVVGTLNAACQAIFDSAVALAGGCEKKKLLLTSSRSCSLQRDASVEVEAAGAAQREEASRLAELASRVKAADGGAAAGGGAIRGLLGALSLVTGAFASLEASVCFSSALPSYGDSPAVSWRYRSRDSLIDVAPLASAVRPAAAAAANTHEEPPSVPPSDTSSPVHRTPVSCTEAAVQTMPMPSWELLECDLAVAKLANSDLLARNKRLAEAAASAEAAAAEAAERLVAEAKVSDFKVSALTAQMQAERELLECDLAV